MVDSLPSEIWRMCAAENQQKWEIEESCVSLHYFTCTLHSDTLNMKIKSTHNFQDLLRKNSEIPMRNLRKQFNLIRLPPCGHSPWLWLAAKLQCQKKTLQDTIFNFLNRYSELWALLFSKLKKPVNLRIFWILRSANFGYRWNRLIGGKYREFWNPL